LFERCRSGDPAAFDEVYQRFGRSLYGTALRILRRPEDAEDVVQEAFVKLYRQAPGLKPGSLGGWLRQVVAHEAIDRLRQRRRRREDELPPADQQPAPSAVPAPGTARLDLERAVQRLPERARLVFLLHDVEGLAHAQVARMLGIQEGTSKSQLFRAREQLRGLLEPALGARG